MKKKFLAVALSCATMAMLVMPSAFADTVANSGTSGEITQAGDGISFEGGGSFTVASATTAQTLAGAKVVCFADTSSVTTSANDFTVTDTDETAGHTVTVKTSDTNFNVTTGGSTVPTSAMELSLEGGTGGTDGCVASASQGKGTHIAAKVAGAGGASIGGNVTLAATAYATGATVTYLDLTTSDQTLVTSDASEQFQYNFRVGQLKITWPQYTKPGTYSTTLVMTYNA